MSPLLLKELIIIFLLIGKAVSAKKIFENCGRTDDEDGRTPARWVYYKLTLSGGLTRPDALHVERADFVLSMWLLLGRVSSSTWRLG